jgi:cholesterol oxidase
VREVTGAPTIQAMVHCIGSMSFLMAMMAGLQGVRAAVCSSLAFYPFTPTENEVKAGLDIGSFLTVLGMKTITTDFNSQNFKDKLLDAVLKLGPTQEKCDSAVCRRILMIYGEVYKHDQLNDATHRAIHEMFGVANLTTFNHIALMVRKKQIVDKDGNDTYLPHLDRLAIPIAFLHGEQNRLFLPPGTSKTLQTLGQANGGQLYTRIQIPNYAHMDLFIGRNAARDVYPEILKQLNKHN